MLILPGFLKGASAYGDFATDLSTLGHSTGRRYKKLMVVIFITRVLQLQHLEIIEAMLCKDFGSLKEYAR